MKSEPSRAELAGVFIICFANLLLEIVLTRLFSATMFYHFTFLAIALALLGVGASGVYVYVRRDRFTPEQTSRDLARFARYFAGATILALVYVLANPIAVVTGGDTQHFTNQTFLQLLLLTAASALPFFFAGVVVALAVTRYSASIDRVYFFDLAGASLATIAVGLLLGLVGALTLVLLIACLGATAAVCFHDDRRGRVIAGAFLALACLNVVWPVVKVPSVKGVKAGRVELEKWNTFSRVTVEKLGPGREDIKIDASASTAISNLGTGKGWSGEISALAYALFDGGPDHALVIGAGGGRDVAHALGSGAKAVTGVEVNPIIARSIMGGRFATGLYQDPRVHIVVDEGRSYVRRSSERYDVIQASLVDTWAATAAGAFALTENTLYTLEAFQDYYAHLTDRGVVTMSRWNSNGGNETTRLALLAAGALQTLGVAPQDARKHLYLAVDPALNLGNLIVKRTEFGDDELRRLDAACVARKWTVLLSPTTQGSSPMEQLVDAGAWSAAVRADRRELRPPTDDKPFFFYYQKPGDLFDLKAFKSGDLSNPTLWIVISLAISLGAMTLAFIILPLVISGRIREKGHSARRLTALAYFGGLGFSFIVVEMALVQKLGLFLGHPSYSLLVVLFGLLLGSSVGARFSGRIPGGFPVIGCGVGLAAVCVVYAFALGPILHAWIGLPVGLRIPIAGLLVVVAGLLMGVMLPSGIKLLGRRDEALIPWAWGINGATSVIGTVASTVVAIHAGFATVFICGAVGYLISTILLYVVQRLAAPALTTTSVEDMAA
jgi:hypothetical protein